MTFFQIKCASGGTIFNLTVIWLASLLHFAVSLINKPPNIIVVMTDDQDVMLGSMAFMPEVNSWLGNSGTTFASAFTSSPVCCPSRSSILTGLHVHNHHVYTNNDNCTGREWKRTHEPRSFATYLQNLGYTTGYFGKYLNDYDGSYVPPGWDRWMGLVRNSRYYNYSVNSDGQREHHGNSFARDYLTDLVANDSIAFFSMQKQMYPDRPVAMVLSMPAPHGPEDSAPPYQDMFRNVTTHRTPSWNVAPNPDKQWILQNTGKMEPIHIEFTDILHRKRLQTLQSVDASVGKLCRQLARLGELENSYLVYTSDHGYHLGQFGLVKGKSMPYDFDTRVPLIIRGPGIAPGAVLRDIALNIDLAPTLIDMAGGQVPKHMDGRSLLDLLHWSKTTRPWRHTILIERGKITKKQLKKYEQLIYNRPLRSSKEGRIEKLCRRDDYKSPCKKYQKWECKPNIDTNRMRLHKCRNIDEAAYAPRSNRSRKRRKQKQASSTMPPKCECPQETINITLDKQACAPGTPPDQCLNKLDSTIDELKTYLANLRQMRRQVNSLVKAGEDASDGLIPIPFALNTSSFNSSQTCECEDKESRHFASAFDKSKNRRKRRRSSRSLDDSILFQVDEPLTTSPKRRRRFGRRVSLPLGKGRRPKASKRQRRGHRSQAIASAVEVGVEAALRHRALRKQERRARREELKRSRQHRKSRRQKKTQCNKKDMKCFSHDNHHWKTPPLWTLGSFCVCQNANNNTYWCIRTINDTDNFLYCEFITGFTSYYDVNKDPYQLHNAIGEVKYPRWKVLHETLNRLRDCRGSEDCDEPKFERPRRSGLDSWIG